MSNLAQQTANMIDLLPESEQRFAFELVKKLVLAWDPDYTKATADEYDEIIQAEKEIAAGEYVTHDEIEW